LREADYSVAATDRFRRVAVAAVALMDRCWPVRVGQLTAHQLLYVSSVSISESG